MARSRNDSLADSVASLNYKWTKDSWISHNHPTVDDSQDKSTFIRGQLDSAKKEEIQKMAKYLDEYRTPEQRRLPSRLASSAMIPQASSSPKSDSHVLDSLRSAKPSTPALTHRSLSPLPTNASLSWQKHSIHYSSAGQQSNAVDPIMRDVSDNRTFEPNFMDDGPSAANFQRAQVSHVEDSYWKTNKNLEDFPEITPSPIKQVDQFYTAKQYPNTIEVSPNVDSLRVASPELQPSPSVRKAASVSSLPLQDSVHIIAKNLTNRSASPSLLASDCRDPSRSRTPCASEHGSELSKVDSQATSLQRAISNALKQNETTTAHRSGHDLTLEESIAARYRQSIAESHSVHPVAKAASPNGADTIQMVSESNLPRIPAALSGHNLSPLRSIEDDLEQSTVTGERTALERLNKGLSGIGLWWDEAKHRIVSPLENDSSIRTVLKDLEMQSYRQTNQVHRVPGNALSEEMNVMKTAEHERMSGAGADVRSETNAEAHSRVHNINPLRNVREDLRDQESFVDKINRWEPEVAAPAVQADDRTSIDAAVSRAQEILNKEPPSLRKDMPSRISMTQTGFVRENSSMPVVDELLTPRGPQVATSTPLTRQMYDPARSTSRDYSGTNHVMSNQKVAHFTAQKVDTPRRNEPVVRPLTAEMMPDAHDQYRCPHEKLYNRLQLSRIDDLTKVEVDNILKNILIQLNVSYDTMPSQIVEIGSRINNSMDRDSHDALWHETLKLRQFAENVHATLYAGEHIEGSVTSTKCLKNMHDRVDKLQAAQRRRQSRRSS